MESHASYLWYGRFHFHHAITDWMKKQVSMTEEDLLCPTLYNDKSFVGESAGSLKLLWDATLVFFNGYVNRSCGFSAKHNDFVLSAEDIQRPWSAMRLQSSHSGICWVISMEHKSCLLQLQFYFYSFSPEHFLTGNNNAGLCSDVSQSFRLIWKRKQRQIDCLFTFYWHSLRSHLFLLPNKVLLVMWPISLQSA